MPEALKCVKELFKDSTDSPLAGLEVYTNFFVTDFDCENNHDHVTSLKVYNEIVKKHEVAGRQSFFHGHQRASLDFTQYTFKFS